MSAAACAALAAAIACAPPPAAVSRFTALWPAPRARRTRWPHLAGPVVVGALIGVALAGTGGAFAGALAALVVRHRRAARRAAQHRATAAEQLAAAIARITDELRAGSHPAAALAGIDADGPHARSVLAPAAAAARLGDGLVPALRRGGADRPEIAGDIERIATAWLLAERHGIPLADLLGRTHEDIRWRVRFAATVRAQLAGPRATAAVLTTLPALGIGLGQLIGADPIGVLRSGPLGQVLLVVGVALLAAGSAWSERILGSAVPR